MKEYETVVVQPKQTHNGVRFSEELVKLEFVGTELVRCKDCKHRPIPNGNNHPLTPKPSEFEWDETCPYVCADEWHNEMPDDNDFCSKGERKEVEE